MRVLLAACAILAAAVLPARAYHHHGHHKQMHKHYAHKHHHLKRWASHYRHRHFSKRVRVAKQIGGDLGRDNVGADCMGTARRQGGPCGCFAEHNFFETTSRLWHGWNLWLADEWRRAFPIVEPAAGTAAVWPGRHVAKVVAVDKARIKVHDSWAIHWVSRQGLVFVQPPTGRRPDLVRYASAAPL